jgi:hypothetical protein
MANTGFLKPRYKSEEWGKIKVTEPSPFSGHFPLRKHQEKRGCVGGRRACLSSQLRMSRKSSTIDCQELSVSVSLASAHPCSVSICGVSLQISHGQADVARFSYPSMWTRVTEVTSTSHWVHQTLGHLTGLTGEVLSASLMMSSNLDGQSEPMLSCPTQGKLPERMAERREAIALVIGFLL